MIMDDQVPIATLRQNSVSNDRIDENAGIVYGCQLVKLGVTACFSGQNGSEEFDTTAEFISELAKMAEGKSLTCHWSHDWRTDDKDPIHAKIGTWKNIRVNSSGDLIGDLHLMPGAKRAEVLWLAQNDPDGAMTSIVFGYERTSDRHVKPLSFRGSDIVEYGAATVALLHKTKDKPMTPEEFEAALLATLSKPAVVSAFAALAAKPEEKPMVSDEDCAAMEKDAGVTDADRKPEDKDKPAFLRAQLACNRANARKASDLVASATLAAEAKLAARIGTNGKITNEGERQDRGGETFDQAITAALSAGCKNTAEAIRLVAAKKPELYNAHMTGGK